MALTQSHSSMLKRFLKEELFDAEFKKKSYVWDNIEKKLNWAGGKHN